MANLWRHCRRLEAGRRPLRFEVGSFAESLTDVSGFGVIAAPVELFLLFVLEPLIDDRGIRWQRDAVQINDLPINNQLNVARSCPLPSIVRVGRGWPSKRAIHTNGWGGRVDFLQRAIGLPGSRVVSILTCPYPTHALWHMTFLAFCKIMGEFL